MTWINLTSSDLLPYLASAQLTALQTKALGSGQSDPLPTLISDIAQRVRALIAAGGWAVSATADSIPEMLRAPTAALVVELAQTRIPGLALTTEQTRQAEQARVLLAKISSSLVPVEAPEDPDTSLSLAQSVTVASARVERVNGRNLRGL